MSQFVVLGGGSAEGYPANMKPSIAPMQEKVPTLVTPSEIRSVSLMHGEPFDNTIHEQPVAPTRIEAGALLAYAETEGLARQRALMYDNYTPDIDSPGFQVRSETPMGVLATVNSNFLDPTPSAISEIAWGQATVSMDETSAVVSAVESAFALTDEQVQQSEAAIERRMIANDLNCKTPAAFPEMLSNDQNLYN